MAGGAPAVECRNLRVAYGSEQALAGLDLLVEPHEAVAVLGPSGSGKTTLLHTLAGFLHPAAGEVRIAGRTVASAGRGLPPEKRDVAVVFQNYALWPHLTAVETVAYPLRRGGLPPAAARRQALKLLERMGVAQLAGRRPAELSGGQQQRVGVARALARGPGALYLFDEPTAHLDTALRAALQDELAQRRKTTGAAAVYATHDAPEALAVADRVTLLRAGVVVQAGASRVVYEQPVDLWAARLTGPASVLRVSIHRVVRDKLVVVLGTQWLTVRGGPDDVFPGTADVLVRPEWTGLGGQLAGVVRHVSYRGPHTDYRLGTPGGEVDVREPGPPSAGVGQEVTWSLHRVWVVAEGHEGLATPRRRFETADGATVGQRAPGPADARHGAHEPRRAVNRRRT